MPDRARADAALLDGEPDEADRREDGDDCGTWSRYACTGPVGVPVRL